MPAPQRVHVTHTYRSDPATVFEALSEHENLGPVMGCKITRVNDGETSRNGPGTTRRLKIGPLPPIEETVTAAEPNSLIEYRISKGGSPLRGHWGVQRLTPTATAAPSSTTGSASTLPFPAWPGSLPRPSRGS